MGEGQSREKVTVRLTIDIPDPQQAISRACPVPLATKGMTWTESCLGESAKLTGVYVIHHGCSIIELGFLAAYVSPVC